MSIQSEWFKKGQDSVRRRNGSGCCCMIDDDGETILQLCAAHKEYLDKEIEKRNGDDQDNECKRLGGEGIDDQKIRWNRNLQLQDQ